MLSKTIHRSIPSLVLRVSKTPLPLTCHLDLTIQSSSLVNSNNNNTDTYIHHNNNIRYYTSSSTSFATTSSLSSNSSSIKNEKNKKSNTGSDGYLPLTSNFIEGKDYKQVYDSFKWEIPEYFNIGTDICDKHLPLKSNHNAVVYEDDAGNVKKITFGQLHNDSNVLCNLLKSYGLEVGDRVGVLLSQGLENPLSHISIFRSGGITIPLFVLFGTEALSYRLSNAEAKFLMTDYDQLDKVLQIKSSIPSLKKIIVFGNKPSNNNTKYDSNLIIEWEKVKHQYSNEFKPVKTKAEDPAIIIFTSGTTGNPKGCLHAHRVLIGHLPGVQFPNNFFPFHERDQHHTKNVNNKPTSKVTTDQLCFYTPADWAWIGGLIDVLLPSLYYGVTVLAHRASKFDAKKMAELMIRNKVTNCFLPPTALKMMRQAESTLPKNNIVLSIGSGGESLGDQLLDFGRNVFNSTINEFYGQTEANLLVGNCSPIMDVRLGSMGKAIPGHRVEIINEKGEVLPSGQVGNIALETPDPVSFLRYWNNPKATESKYVGRWLVTGDLGKKDKDGYFWYVGRDDDIINSSGYRIGPSEIEHCILAHRSVANCAVIGVPDDLRGEVVKACIVLVDGCKPTKELEEEIKEKVKVNLAAYEYPRIIEYMDSLPMTTTGKIIRRELRDRHVKQQQQQQKQPTK